MIASEDLSSTAKGLALQMWKVFLQDMGKANGLSWLRMGELGSVAKCSCFDINRFLTGDLVQGALLAAIAAYAEAHPAAESVTFTDVACWCLERTEYVEDDEADQLGLLFTQAVFLPGHLSATFRHAVRTSNLPLRKCATHPLPSPPP